MNIYIYMDTSSRLFVNGVFIHGAKYISLNILFVIILYQPTDSSLCRIMDVVLVMKNIIHNVYQSSQEKVSQISQDVSVIY